MLDFKRTYTLPFKNPIPNYIDIYLNKVSKYKRYTKFIKRVLYIYLKGQKDFEVFKILPEHKDILWINISAPSLGDSLMDLSSRIMLKDKNLDLYTDEKNSHIYENDFFFNNIYTVEKSFEKSQYDLIILDSYSTRSVKVKAKVAPKTQYVGMFGHFNGPEVNRTLFSFFQMNHLLGEVESEIEIDRIAKNVITISKEDQEMIKYIIPNKYLVFVLGGEWNYKTYQNWDEVISKIIDSKNDLRIVLVGSKNANEISEKILKKFPNTNFTNFVAKLSFNQTVEVIRKSQLVFCCDGGLMHATNAVNAKNISLLARLTPPMLLTKNSDLHYLFDENDVNNICSKDVLKKYHQIFSAL